MNIIPIKVNNEENLQRFVIEIGVRPEQIVWMPKYRFHIPKSVEQELLKRLGIVAIKSAIHNREEIRQNHLWKGFIWDERMGK